MAGDTRVDDAARELYAVPPDEFLGKRSELAQAATGDGAADAGREIAKLRKPTLAAWIVNAHALHDDTVSTRIIEVGEQLRAAQDALDAAALRELSKQRRVLVTQLTDAALRRAGRTDAGSTLREDVRGSFDAAVADPQIAARLGLLQRAESFSGFGFGESVPPQLTLVRGGRREQEPKGKPAARARDGDSGRHAAKADSGRGVASHSDPAAERALQRAEADADAAETQVAEARAAQLTAGEAVKQAERDLGVAKHTLAEAKTTRDGAREAHRGAVARRREARRALDRARKAR